MLRFACSLLLALAVFVAGCGGGDGTRDAPSSAVPADGAYARRADAVCAAALAETRRLGREFSHSDRAAPDVLTLTTEGLVKPGIAIRERMANRLRALPKPRRGEAAVAAYLELFDPLDALSQQRLEAGQEGDLNEAQRLEKLMRSLALEQEEAARQAGLATCATDFVGAAFASGASN